jgi:hypothetical protein
VWELESLPTLEGATNGRVTGTDGDGRFIGSSEGRPVLWDKPWWGRRWRVTDLGYGAALDVNRAGIVVGSNDSDRSSGSAVMWKGRKQIGLAVPEGAQVSVAVGINDSGMIVGHSWGPWPRQDSPSQSVGLVWSVDSPDRYRTFLPPEGLLEVQGLSETGLIVGTTRDPAITWTRAIAGTPQTGLHYLKTTSATTDSAAVALAVAAAGDNTDSAAFSAAGGYIVGEESGQGVVWVDGVPRPLPGADFSVAAVNRFGQVAGQAECTDSLRPAVWIDGVRTDLPVPADAIAGEAAAVTDSGQIGGSLYNHGGPVT